MDWKLLLIFIFITCDEIYARPGIRSPPAELHEKFINESETTLSSNDTKISPILTDGRDFPSLNVQSKNQLQSINRTATTTTKPPNKFHYDSENYHAGVAVPLTQEDIDRELHEATVPSSTPREGLSTWILLSGTATTPQPSRRVTTSTVRPPTKKDDKIAKIEPTNQKPALPAPVQRNTIKPKLKPTPSKANKNQEEPLHKRVEPNLVRRKKPASTAAQPKKKPTTAATTTTTTTTISPTTSPIATTEFPPVSSTTAETTTFLILEPKDADFDMPQDRSPGPTTKKPRRNNNNKKKKKKNGLKSKTELAEKKPPKNQNSIDKPLTTKIYNYLAREVMPTVGVGLVGLAVTAGIATYFLGTPFGALRRSYEVAERKDDMYFYNNEEYAGNDGQSEEEVFGKVIAGMPVDSPYRNTITHSNYRPQPQQQQQNPVRYNPKFARHPQQQQQQQIRYRNGDPGYYNQGVYPKSRPQESNAQQYFRYNNEGNAYRTNNAQNSEIPSTYSNSYNPEATDELPSSSDSGVKIKIVTPAVTTEIEPITESPMLDNDVLRRRSQFVVGSIHAVSTEDPSSDDSRPIIDTVPEHGPRRRRRRSAAATVLKKIDEKENEIDGAIPDDIKEDNVLTTLAPLSAIEEVTVSKDTETIDVETVILPTNQPPAETVFDLIRNIFEIKVRMGLSFLQNTTNTFAKYLKTVEQRIEESKVFSKTHRRTT